VKDPIFADVVSEIIEVQLRKPQIDLDIAHLAWNDTKRTTTLIAQIHDEIGMGKRGPIDNEDKACSYSEAVARAKEEPDYWARKNR
jgi:hypothetical protein